MDQRAVGSEGALVLRHDTAKSAAAVTELCRTMGMMTLAEGVETEDQFRLLQASNCDEAQGYLLSPLRPVLVARWQLYAED